MDEINYTVPPNAQRVGVVGRRPMAHILWHHGPHRRHCWFYPLINEERSLFSVSDFLVRTTTTVQSRSTLWRIGAGLTPSISSNIPAQENYRQLFRHLHASPNKPTVLSIGGSIAGTSMDQLLADQSIEFVDPDATFGPRTSIVCDAHDIPFTDGSFDLVIAQAVLEHVVDPHRWVEKIHRVLKDDGLVDAQTPYMQQVHSGRYDISRFTHLGHRRLFRTFTEVRSGSFAGPGTVLAWACQHLLLSCVQQPYARALAEGFARSTLFWLKYLDPFFVDRSGALDAASAYYFIGRKSDQVLTDTELVTLYKGAGWSGQTRSRQQGFPSKARRGQS